MKNPNQEDAYGNKKEKPDYPTLKEEVFTGLYGSTNVFSVWSGIDTPTSTFTSQTIIFSPKSEKVVGSLVASFTNIREKPLGWYDIGDFVNLSVMSPKQINLLGTEIAEKCEYSKPLNLHSMNYPSTGTENVRALNLAVNDDEK